MTHESGFPFRETQLHLSESEIALRKRWLDFNERDEAILREEIDPLVDGSIDQLISEMYRHFLTFDETRSFFPDDAVLKRAQTAQKQYFSRLTKGNYNLEYVTDRLKVGSTHHRIDLDPKWYLGAYNTVISWYLPKLVDRFKDRPDELFRTISALMKLIFFDMGLAIECYIAAKEKSIREHRDLLREVDTERRITKSIVESAPVGIVALSEDLVCLECNQIFLQIIDDASSDGVVGKSLFKVAPGLDTPLFQEVLRAGHPYRQTAVSLQLSSVSPDANYWDWAMWPVKDDLGKVNSLVAMFTNVSDRVLLQQQREDFVATLTHDLKTPVLATNRAIGFLLDGDFGPVSEPQREVLDTISQSNKALYSLVQTLLDVYKFDSGVKELNLRGRNLASIVSQMVTEIMPLSLEKGVELKAVLPDPAYEVTCDEDEIRRVLQNLIDNSLKFTPTGGRIFVSMTQTIDTTLICVSDSGKGISEENKPKLFQRFWQAGSTGRYYASTGLGLYLSRRILEAHGGRIWCESILGEGSSFFFELRNSS